MITSRFASNLFETGDVNRIPANYFHFDTAHYVNSTPAIDILAKFNNHRFICRDWNTYSGCQKNVPVFKRFFLQPYIRLCRTSEFRNIIMENGIKQGLEVQHE